MTFFISSYRLVRKNFEDEPLFVIDRIEIYSRA